MPKNKNWRLVFCFFLACGFFLMFLKPAIAERYALIVVVWDYPDNNLKLEAPPNDLSLMKSLLAAYSVRQEHMVILQNPNKGEIKQAFQELSERPTPQDSLLFYFSGHGTRIIDSFSPAPGDEAQGRHPDLDDEALLPVDVDIRNPQTYLLDDEINLLLRQFRTRNITCIIDTCFSGDVLRERRLGLPKGIPTSMGSTSQTSTSQDVLDDAADFAVLFAAAPYNQAVYELIVPIWGVSVPISAMTYSLYRNAMQASLMHRELINRIQQDHQQWNLPWKPVIEGPESRFNEVFLEGGPVQQRDDILITLKTISGSDRNFHVSELISTGGVGIDTRLGRLRTSEGHRRMLAIGVDSYPPPVQSLNYADDDAKAVASVCQEAGYMVTLMTPDSLIQPTRDNILEQLNLHAQLEGIELLLVYLSGHGGEENGEGYFIPMDLEKLSVEELYTALSSANTHQCVIIVDACRVAPKRDFINGLLPLIGETNAVLTSCNINQSAPEVPEFEHGLFTYFLLKGLRRVSARDRGAAAEDGTVTLLSLSDYVMWSLEKYSSYHNKVTPILVYRGGNLQLLNNNEIAPGLPISIPEKTNRDIRTPPNGRFYVYKNVAETTLLPFIPYGWMWGNALGEQGFDEKSVTNMIGLKMVSAEKPYDDQGTCIQFDVTWRNQTWIAVGFISGPDEPAWWGESNHAWYYDLSGLARRRLVFHARSPLPGVRIQVKVGILYDKLWGDSLQKLAITKWIRLSEEWTRYELDLSNSDLSYVCNGFTVVVEKRQQDNPNAPVQFFLDEIYFE